MFMAILYRVCVRRHRGHPGVLRAACVLLCSSLYHSCACFASSFLSDSSGVVVFKSHCSGNGNLKFTSTLVARFMVLQTLGGRLVFGALSLMRCVLACATFWFCCCHRSSEKNCHNKTRLWRGSNMYVHWARLFGNKKMLQSREVTKPVSFANVCRSTHTGKQLLFFSPQIPQVYIPFSPFSWCPKVTLFSLQEGRGIFWCIKST